MLKPFDIQNILPYCLMALLSGLWILLAKDSIIWLGHAFTTNYSILNLILLATILFSCIYAVTKSSFRLFKAFYIQLNLPATLLFLISAAGYMISQTWLRMNICSTVFFLTGLYALSGFLMTVSAWLKGLVPLLLILFTLPFGTLLDIYFGFPLRLYAADMVSQGLGSIPDMTLNKHTIITIENRSAEVSGACSGLNGLWSACIFYFFINWYSSNRINLRWCILFAGMLMLFLGFNISRIYLLVLLEIKFLHPEISKLIHIPLGIAGFCFTCILTYLMMNSPFLRARLFMKPFSGFLHKKNLPSEKQTSKTTVSMVLICCVLTTIFCLWICHTIPLKTPSTLAPVKMKLPEEINITPLPLTPAEQIVFKKDESSYYKVHVTYKHISGSVLIVRSKDWRGHHPPDLCVQSNGYSIEHSQTKLAGPDFPVTLLSLSNTPRMACYWFQSPDKITQDHAERVWMEVSTHQPDWIMVSILFDQSILKNEQESIEFLNILKQRIHFTFISS